MGLLLLTDGTSFMELATTSFDFLLLTDGEDKGIDPAVHTLEDLGFVNMILTESGYTRTEL